MKVGATETAAIDAPGLVVLDRSGELVAATAPARAWFAELGHDHRSARPVPAEVSTATGLLHRSNTDDSAATPVPRLRVRTRAGRWAVLHASWLDNTADDAEQMPVIIEPATALEVAEVIMQAYGLTERERTMTKLVCQGYSASEIAAQLWISNNPSRITSSRSSTRPASAVAAKSWRGSLPARHAPSRQDRPSRLLQLTARGTVMAGSSCCRLGRTSRRSS